MRCIVCEKNEMEPYFSKKYLDKNHNFVICPNCGLVINETVYNMSKDEWKQINNFHKKTQGVINTKDDEWKKRIERLLPQAELIAELMNKRIIGEGSRIVDYGGGDGLFCEYVNQKCNNIGVDTKKYEIGTYEKYLMLDGKDGYYKESEMTSDSFDCVISSAVLEHMIGAKDVDDYFRLVKDDGIVVFHTLVCEKVPKDSNWFYIEYPVHCTLWTNKAMEKMFKKNKYLRCVYHLPSKMWIWFKDVDKYNMLRTTKENCEGWFFSDSFIDYWKAPPYHQNEVQSSETEGKS